MRTRTEIQEELFALKELFPQITFTNPHGDDLQEAIRVQIRVIGEAMPKDDIYGNYDDIPYLFEVTVGAWRWLHEDDIAPSQLWAEIMDPVDTYKTAA